MSQRTIGVRVATAWRILTHKGFSPFIRKVLGSVTKQSLSRPLYDYEFVSPTPLGHPVEEGAVARNTINWVVPPFAAGAGGHTTIFRFIHHLEHRGYDCRVIVLGGIYRGSAGYFRDLIGRHFFPLKAAVYVDFDDTPPAYVTVATGWETAYLVRRLQSTVHKCYFVQDFEPWFYSVGTRYCLAEATYRFGFRGITAGTWLAQKLARDYGMQADAIGFSCDKTVYHPLPRERSPRKKVFFYARPSTERRAFEIGMLTLAELCRRMPNVIVVFAGGDLSKVEIPFDHVSEGVVDVNRLAQLFNQCDVALVLSLTNLSLLPLEIMACGTPVVSNSGPWVSWLLNDTNAFLAEPTVPALADALHHALTDEHAHSRVRIAGLELANRTSWEQEADRMTMIFKSIGGNDLHA